MPSEPSGEKDEFEETVLADDTVLGQVPRTETGEVDLVNLIDQPAWKTILISLVKGEKMDPWNIDIAGLADKYLQKINALDGTDLRLPANAILASAILLKFKARILRLTEIDDDDELEGNGFFTEEEKKVFEGLLPELVSARKFREGKISLDALVDTIEVLLEKSKKKSQSLVLDRPDFKIPISNFDLSEKMDEVYTLIKDLVDSEGLVLFSRLARDKNVSGIVETFIPVLFLANKGRINVWQDEFFGEIFISLNEEN